MFECQNCGYESNDIMALTYHEMFNCDLAFEVEIV